MDTETIQKERKTMLATEIVSTSTSAPRCCWDLLLNVSIYSADICNKNTSSSIGTNSKILVQSTTIAIQVRLSRLSPAHCWVHHSRGWVKCMHAYKDKWRDEDMESLCFWTVSVPKWDTWEEAYACPSISIIQARNWKTALFRNFYTLHSIEFLHTDA